MNCSSVYLSTEDPINSNRMRTSQKFRKGTTASIGGRVSTSGQFAPGFLKKRGIGPESDISNKEFMSKSTTASRMTSNDKNKFS
jgi:hypothetical protein